MRVLKFGGTSVGDAARIRAAADIVEGAMRDRRCFVVVSAVSGITNHLVGAAQQAAEGAAIGEFVAHFADVHARIATDLASDLGERAINVTAGFDALTKELRDLLQGIALLRDASPHAQAHVCSLGERASVVMMGGLLDARGKSPVVVDARAAIALSGDPLSATPDPVAIRARLGGVLPSGARLFVMGGFFGGDARGKTLLLGRGGSDWSAALVAAAIDAELLEIWTDVDGIYTADPRVVPDAKALNEVSFAEAAELSYFGAKVLHPQTIAPARDNGIPVRVCNSFRPKKPGTIVKATAGAPPHAVRGISFLDDIAMIDISGSGLKGVPGVAARAFGACAAREVSVVLITQASSECSISFCVANRDVDRAVHGLNEVFDVEIAAGRVDPVEITRGLAILSIVGDGMQQRPGVAGTFFAALADIGSNVVGIAQGSSERSISAVIDAREGKRAMNHVHRCFFDTAETIELYLCGVGTVGSRLLSHAEKQRPKLLAQGVVLRVCGLADSKRIATDPAGIDLAAWSAALDGPSAQRIDGSDHDFAPWLASIGDRRPTHPVFVDCTSAEAVSRAYTALFDGGFHVVTANKKANSSETPYWRELRKRANRKRRKFLYETNVGAGLPVIDTVKNLVKGGDDVVTFEGVLSGTLSFLYGLLDDGVPLSEAIRTAKERGFTEPDPRDDLSGLDVARKVLILAREFGRTLDLADVKVEGVLPADFAPAGDVPAFLDALGALDAPFRAKIDALKAEGRVLRYVGTIDSDGVRVGPVAVGADHPLRHVRNGENALSFLTEHYRPTPLVVRGYGAGADVTAAGVLADVLRVVYWNAE